MDELRNFEAWALAQDDLSEVVMRVRDIATEMGFVRQSYHFTPVFDKQNSVRALIYSEGFSPAWLKNYDDPAFRASDPIPSYTMQAGRMVLWSEALEACKDRPGVAEYAKAMREEGLIHGFGVPLFGPRGRNAYASFDRGHPPEPGEEKQNLQLRTICQIAHQRVCFLYEKSREQPVLSERETEVLQWMAQGKSNTDIGTILNISPETVRTYTQRIYLKLDSNDRTSATVKGLKLGLIHGMAS